MKPMRERIGEDDVRIAATISPTMRLPSKERAQASAVNNAPLIRNGTCGANMVTSNFKRDSDCE